MPLEPASGRAVRIARRALALRCPRCGGMGLFTGWFTMRSECPLCGLRFERAQGYWVGAIYVNYGTTTLIALLGAFALWGWLGIDMAVQLGLWLPFCALFPLWFFRYSRSLWLAIEFFANPEP
jgi:uncharacterized protein (DUF983 family)